MTDTTMSEQKRIDKRNARRLRRTPTTAATELARAFTENRLGWVGVLDLSPDGETLQLQVVKVTVNEGATTGVSCQPTGGL